MASPTLTGSADLAPVAVARGRKPRKALDLKYQPGFALIAFFCIALLYAPTRLIDRAADGPQRDRQIRGHIPRDLARHPATSATA